MKLAIAILVFVVTLQVLKTNAQENEMPNDFLVSKWRMWFKTLDVNNDGEISRKYVEEARNRFSELHHLAGGEKNSVGEVIEKWWNDYVFQGKHGTISEQEFVDNLTNKFKVDKQKFLQTLQDCFKMIFSVVDFDGDGSVSEEEYVFALEAYGHENVDLDTQFFKAYNPVDGRVPLKDIVASWVDFTTSEDKSTTSVEKTNFELGV